jgi:phage tail-like protein
MPLLKSTIKSSYPIPAYNYRVSFFDGDLKPGGEATSIGFSEVTGLNIEYEHVTYKTGLSFLSGYNIIRGMASPVKITLKKGMILNKHRDFFYQWLKSEDKSIATDSLKKDIIIDLCDERGIAIVRWLVKGAVPVRIEMPNFNSNDNEAAIESLEVVGHGLKVNFTL